MTAGLLGVPMGSYAAQRLRPIISEADPLICAFGLITSAPFVYIGLVIAKYSAPWCFFVVFMAEVTLNLTWSLVADILLVSYTLHRIRKKWNKVRTKWIYAELLDFSH